MARRALVDSDVLSAVLRGNQRVLSRAREYLSEHRQFEISIITQYEILRGLKSKGATGQLERFEKFCGRNHILPITGDVISKASDIYAALRAQGNLIGDADILIAATALTNDLCVATNNEDHFSRVPGLVVDNWLK